MSFSLMPHEFTKVGSQQYRVSKIRPYIRLGHENEALYIQDGKVWTEDGVEVKAVPAWFKEEARKCNPAALAETGYKVD